MKIDGYSLGDHFDAFVEGQLSSGRYADVSEVLRDALRLMEDREARLSSVDASIARGLGDIEAGRIHDADTVFDELEALYSLAAEPSGM